MRGDPFGGIGYRVVLRRTMSATSRHSLAVLVGVVLIGSVTRSRPRLVAATGAVYRTRSAR